MSYAVQVCDGCGRKSWAAARTVSCGMPQPDGTRCAGTFRHPDNTSEQVEQQIERLEGIVAKRSAAMTRPSIDDLQRAIEDSHKFLGKIGEGDWTPQDSAHTRLLTTVERLLASGGLRTGRIVHGDA